MISYLSTFPVETFRSVQLWLTVAALTLAPLFFGAVDQLSVAIWTVLLSVVTLVGPARPLEPAQGRILWIFILVCAAYALVAALQVTPELLGQFADPIWQRASDLLGLQLSPRVSARAEIPPEAIGHFLLLVTAFAGGFFVGTSRRQSDVLFTSAQYAILLYAAYGMAALVLTPGLVLWAPKLAYRGSLTATFVNHNTAATLIGAGVILWFCSACLSLQSIRLSSIRLLLLIPSNETIAFKILLRSGAGFACFFALLFTGSRGGLIATCLGLLAAIGLMVANRLKPRLGYMLGAGSLAVILIGGWLTQVGRIGSKGLFDDGRWSVYGSCIEAIRQRPLFGTGIGTFADVFPSLRSAEASGWGVWDYAHSTILELAVEMGLPIAAIVVIAAAASVVVLARAALRSQGRSRSALSAITGIAVLSYVHSLIDFSLQIPGYLIVFAILLGCGLARASAQPVPVEAARSGEVAAAA
ncbi:MAG TPA: O-antigen ligase family protein [Bradyrhizobium sp.]|nr:O-antigen ligase family protein [Bradyrhizobium sp.]